MGTNVLVYRGQGRPSAADRPGRARHPAMGSADWHAFTGNPSSYRQSYLRRRESAQAAVGSREQVQP